MLIEIEGADQALKALRKLEPETAKQVGREVSKIGRSLAGDINSSVPSGLPMSGWKQTSGSRGARGNKGWPAWSGIKASSRRRGMSVYVDSASNPSAVAAIYESAGFKGGTSANGKRFIENLSRHGELVGMSTRSGRRSGRLARRALAESWPQIEKDIEKAANDAADAVNRLMP